MKISTKDVILMKQEKKNILHCIRILWSSFTPPIEITTQVIIANRSNPQAAFRLLRVYVCIQPITVSLVHILSVFA